jgi:hypothetical protein
MDQRQQNQPIDTFPSMQERITHLRRRHAVVVAQRVERHRHTLLASGEIRVSASKLSGPLSTMNIGVSDGQVFRPECFPHEMQLGAPLREI